MIAFPESAAHGLPHGGHAIKSSAPLTSQKEYAESISLSLTSSLASVPLCGGGPAPPLLIMYRFFRDARDY